MSVLELKDISKIYRQGDKHTIASDGINLKIEENDLISLTGASGSGKTTLLQIMSGILEPSGGSVWFNGVNIHKLTTDELAKFRRRNIGYIFQNYNLVSFLTAEENIIMPSLLDGVMVDKHHLNELVERLGIQGKLNSLPNEMSGGEQQRTAIARALINRPKIIFADEPTGNLDSDSSEKIVELLLDLKTNGNTIIIVTHDINIANRADIIYKMSDGKISLVKSEI